MPIYVRGWLEGGMTSGVYDAAFLQVGLYNIYICICVYIYVYI